MYTQLNLSFRKALTGQASGVEASVGTFYQVQV